MQQFNKVGQRAIHVAALTGSLEVLEVLQERGVDWTALTREGDTVLHLLAHHGQLAGLQWLQQRLDNGTWLALLSVPDNDGKTALHRACFQASAAD